ncbi:uncharacterized protein LOC123979855 [Micropterus dolomieu]|uniref:uncharacterized protein LOC123979855 n=1 Tax=Micropterus dolomieu TaxID=147949 RepID=UPI001E8DD800|nr:uncharacterized protein LOC123979855 [Micropterus dolomieu]
MTRLRERRQGAKLYRQESRVNDKPDKDTDNGEELSNVNIEQIPTGEEDRDSTPDESKTCTTQLQPDTESQEEDIDAYKKTLGQTNEKVLPKKKYTHSVKQSKMYLNKCVLQTQDMKLEESGHVIGEEERPSEKPADSIFGKSPFTRAFQVRREQAECDILSDDAVGIKNHYHCPGVIDVLLKNYMGILPLWSGLLLGDLSRHGKITTCKTDGSAKTRDTNCHVELWFGLVKHSILLKKRYLRPEFISKMFASIQGRYIEHIGQHNLPIQIFDKNFASSSRPDDDHEEQWNKRDSSVGHSRSKSKYFNPPKTLSKPKSPHAAKVKRRGKKVDQDQPDKDKKLTLLWKKRDTEVVVALVPSQIKGRNILIHRSELRTLRPPQWLTGEVIEALFHVAAHTFSVVDTIYLMSHYTAGGILFGERTELPRHSLPKLICFL